MTDMKTLEKMNAADLVKFIEDKREEVRTFRFGTGGRNVNAVQTAKKDIARALTLQTTLLKEAKVAKK